MVLTGLVPDTMPCTSSLSKASLLGQVVQMAAELLKVDADCALDMSVKTSCHPILQLYMNQWCQMLHQRHDDRHNKTGKL